MGDMSGTQVGQLAYAVMPAADRLYGRASTDDVVQSVRRLRAERDQLRLRDRDHSRTMRQVFKGWDVLLGFVKSGPDSP